MTSATKPKNLGTFDYAHLRVPLPKNVSSGIFNPAPPSYFLMRRSRDGFVSATGMFKATFPWAQVSEEEEERRYIKSLSTTSPDETAGNIWIPPAHALELAEEYQISIWIEALLDNTPIEVNSGYAASPKTITSPPKFTPEYRAKFDSNDTTPSAASLRRSRRSASPSKLPSPKKPIATPRKSKKDKAATLDNSAIAAAKKSLEDGAKESKKKAASTVTKDSDESASNEVVRVIVDTDVVANGDTETTHTHVEVEMPAGSPDLPLPEDTAAMIEKAKEMVEAATKADAEAAAANGAEAPRAKKSKRKVDELEAEEEAGDLESVVEVPVAKRTRIETELKKEKVKTRALIGISATLAIGYVSNLES